MTMDGWQIAGLLLGSSVICALITLVGKRLERKDTIKDKDDETAAQIEELRTETSEQIGQINRRIDQIDVKVDTISDSMTTVMMCTKAQSYDRIRHLGLTYIKAGNIAADEYKTFSDMYTAYSKIEEDPFLKRLMSEVSTLRVVPDRAPGHNDE